MICKLKSDGSGGFSGISNTIGLGSRKHIAYCGFHILVLFILSTALQTNDSHVCLCLTLALQRSNEMYKTIKHPYRRVLCSTKNDLICYHFTISLLVSTLSLWVTCLILLCGDLQPNPGPDSVEGSIGSVSSCSSSSFEYLSKHLSIMHLNIQSIVPKLDLIEGEHQHMTSLSSLKVGLILEFRMQVFILNISYHPSEQTGSIALVVASLFMFATHYPASAELTWKSLVWRLCGLRFKHSPKQSSEVFTDPRTVTQTILPPLMKVSTWHTVPTYEIS